MAKKFILNADDSKILEADTIRFSEDELIRLVNK